MEALRTSCLSLGANAVGSRDEMVAALATRLTVALPDGACSPTVLESTSGEEEPAPRGDPSDEAASLIQLRSGAQLSARPPSPPTLVIETSALGGFDAAVQPSTCLPLPPPLVAYGREASAETPPEARELADGGEADARPHPLSAVAASFAPGAPHHRAFRLCAAARDFVPNNPFIPTPPASVTAAPL